MCITATIPDSKYRKQVTGGTNPYILISRE